MTGRRLDLPGPSDLPTFVVRTGGNDLPRTWAITTATVLHAIDRIPVARLSIRDGAVSDQGFRHAASGHLAPGQAVEIHGGYHGKTTPLFAGIVTRQRIHGGGGRAQLEVVVKDPAVRMTIDRRSAHHGAIPDHDLCRRLGERHGIDVDMEPSPITHDDLVQYQCTDWDLMLARARANSRWVIASMGRLAIIEPQISEPRLKLEWGATLLDFDLVCDAERQIERQLAVTPSARSEVSVSRQAGRLGTAAPVTGLVAEARRHHAGDLTDPELGAWADATLLERELTRLRGWVRCQGTAQAAPGDTITLSDLGKRFDGTAIVTGVCHRFIDGNWTTDFAFGAEPDADLAGADRPSAPAAGGLLPAVPGLQLGRVTRLEGDPLGHDRLRVRLPVIDGDSTTEGNWARLATDMAGAGRGAVFRPEVGDHVVVGFLEGDPRHPVVLGSVFSDEQSPVEASDANDEKAFVSRSGVRWTIDEAKPALTFTTPGGRTATLDDGGRQITLSDDAGNRLVLDAEGIALSSPGTITIDAGDDLVLSGGAVTVNAARTLALDGSAGTQLKSAGEVAISGAMIKLNS